MLRRREAPAFSKSPPVVLNKGRRSHSSHMVTNEASERVTSISITERCWFESGCLVLLGVA